MMTDITVLVVHYHQDKNLCALIIYFDSIKITKAPLKLCVEYFSKANVDYYDHYAEYPF